MERNKIQPLIDADVLVYEVGFAAEAGWESEGFPPFSYVEDLLNSRIANICAMVEATEEPLLFLTGDTNFRHDIAVSTPYKSRAGNKPFHYKNIKAYMRAVYSTITSEGMEADDLLAITQTERPEETIICTRDKDLRAVPGWHYGWELGAQPSFGPAYVSYLGGIRLSYNRKSIKGEGILFFYSQCLTGDSVDSIPGLGGCGTVKAFKILEGAQSEGDAFKAVLEAYKEVHGDMAEKVLLEQGRLLWMTRQIYADGKPVLWEFPDV